MITTRIEEKKLEQLVQRIEPQGKLVRAWPLKGGISAQMTALEILRQNGQTWKVVVRRPPEWVLKWNPRAARDEFRVLQMVQSLGITTAEPYYLDESGELLSAPCLVIEYVEGQPEYSPPDISDFVSQMAKELTRIHQIKATNPDLSFLPRQSERLTTKLREQPAELNASLNEGRIRESLKSVWPLRRQNEPVLLHGDFWPGNILWQNGQIVAVIDWEEAAVGDPLADLAISRLDILWLCGSEAMHEFTRQYRARSMIDFKNLPYWDLVAALRPAQNIGEWARWWPEFGREDINEQTMRNDHGWFVAQAYRSFLT